ncbi:polyprenyl synthetase family protein [Chelatococcus reniformis]|uniref:polyprenyl synthetase family protein n=1 Tax=Chelatococcus reniformis TaxID=1494448 RepID=UPI001FCEEE5A|nr:farnesyl diphosphate synthase [Chelatococcus reniformis]
MRLQTAAEAVEAHLAAILVDDARPGERRRPVRLMQAMRHAALGGGKRLRPFLTIETGRLCGAPEAAALRAGCAIELVHCYSLVHDDLPSMDDDEVRRGRPTVHRAFDEATAILAGDGLLTLAFDVLADEATHARAEVRGALVAGLARAAGAGGMVGGQMHDLAAEGRFGTAALGEPEIRELQAMKTGAILAFAVRAGALVGEAPADARRHLDTYGAALGAAFQVADDLLDYEGDSAAVGKRTGKDAAAGKATLVAALGPDGARARCAALVDEAIASLVGFGPEADILREAARFVAVRRT